MAQPKHLSSLRQLAALTPGIDAYSDAGARKKELMHSQGKAFLRALATDLGLDAADRDIRSNLGGIAVSGEVTLHSDSLYVQLSESFIAGDSLTVMYRQCQGRSDYTGGTNHFTTIAQLAEGAYPGFVAKCKTMMATATTRPHNAPRH